MDKNGLVNRNLSQTEVTSTTRTGNHGDAGIGQEHIFNHSAPV